MSNINLADVKLKWDELKTKLKEQFDEEPDLQTIIFLIGVQELGRGHQKFTKDQKMDLMHIATCKLLSRYGYYELEGLDDDGWPHWIPKEKLPHLDVKQQDILLKQSVLDYFIEEGLISA